MHTRSKLDILKCHQVAQVVLALKGLQNCRDMLLVGNPLQSALLVSGPKPHVVNPVHSSPRSKRTIPPDLGPHDVVNSDQNFEHVPTCTQYAVKARVDAVIQLSVELHKLGLLEPLRDFQIIAGTHGCCQKIYIY